MAESVLVAIKCITYNHEAYIRDCLDGFVMQKTSFPFVAIVHDDASTDGTAAIIREYAEKYPDIIKPIFEEENQYSKRDGSLSRIMDDAIQATGCKYVALCEGDDYWIDPYKLQRQVDILQRNPSVSLVHSSFYFLDNQTNSKTVYTSTTYDSKNDLMLKIINGNKYRIQTVTTCFRRQDYDTIMQSDPFLYQSGYFYMGDTQLWTGLLTLGNVYYENTPTSVYRINIRSATNNRILKKRFRFDLSCSELRLYLLKKYNLGHHGKTLSYIGKQYNLDLLRYRLFQSDFVPLYKPQMRYAICWKIINRLGMVSILRRFLEKKYAAN